MNIGDRQYALTIIEITPYRIIAKCDCGSIKNFKLSPFKRAKSCGCLRVTSVPERVLKKGVLIFKSDPVVEKVEKRVFDEGLVDEEIPDPRSVPAPLRLCRKCKEQLPKTSYFYHDYCSMVRDYESEMLDTHGLARLPEGGTHHSLDNVW